MSRFPLGIVVITPAAAAALKAVGTSPSTLLNRHVTGDWGDVSASSRVQNDTALVEGGQLFSVYEHRGQVTWVITEQDRSATTILLPSDY